MKCHLLSRDLMFSSQVGGAARAADYELQSAASALVVVAAAAFYFRARLGGVTGDCLGAAFMVQEIAILATVRIALP